MQHKKILTKTKKISHHDGFVGNVEALGDAAAILSIGERVQLELGVQDGELLVVVEMALSMMTLTGGRSRSAVFPRTCETKFQSSFNKYFPSKQFDLKNNKKSNRI